MRVKKTSRRDDLERTALIAARQLVDRMRSLYRELERLTGAPIAVHRVLKSIDEEPGMTASRLALKLGMQRPALSHVLKNMAERGWIERRRLDADQRTVRLHVTGDGQKTVRATSGRAVGTMQRAVRKLSRTELNGLERGLQALIRYLPPP